MSAGITITKTEISNIAITGMHVMHINILEISPETVNYQIHTVLGHHRMSFRLSSGSHFFGIKKPDTWSGHGNNLPAISD